MRLLNELENWERDLMMIVNLSNYSIWFANKIIFISVYLAKFLWCMQQSSYYRYQQKMTNEHNSELTDNV